MSILSRTPLNALRAIEAVARTGSLGRAGDELGVTLGAVSQQLRKAEEALDVVLFERRPAGLVPTAALKRMLPHLEIAFRHLADAVSAATRDQEGVLTITAAPDFASRWLVPRLSRFTQAHPQVELHFVSTAAILDLARDDIDLGVRMGRGGWPNVAAELLIGQAIFPACTPALAARLATPADLAHVPVLRDNGVMVGWSDWFAGIGAPLPSGLAGPAFTDPLLGFEAALAGQGVILTVDFLAADALADRRLVRPFPQRVTVGVGYWFVTSPAKAHSRKVRLFHDWLAGEIAATAAAFAD